jgi:hypothetical protein
MPSTKKKKKGKKRHTDMEDRLGYVNGSRNCSKPSSKECQNLPAVIFSARN